MAVFSNRFSYLNDALPGIALGLITRYQEIEKCLVSDCDSWVLKVEKVLIHLAFIFGYASPSRLVWNVMQELLKKFSEAVPVYFKNHQGLEDAIRMGISLLEYVGLVQLWDRVRDSSICMRFHNCDSDFFGQLSNIKIAFCRVEDPNNYSRQPSTCEKIFNDSPLILLALGMLVMALFADSKLSALELPIKPPASKPPPDPPKPDPKPETPKEDKPKDGTESEPSNPPKDPDKTQPEPPKEPDKDQPVTPTNPKQNKPPRKRRKRKPKARRKRNSSLHDDDDDDISDILSPIEVTSLEDMFQNIKNGFKKPNSKDQVIHGKCLKCNKEFYQTVPRPWIICCSKSLKMGEKAIKFKPKSFSKEELVSIEVIEKVLTEVKCKYCKDKIKKRLKAEVEKKKKKSENRSARDSRSTSPPTPKGK